MAEKGKAVVVGGGLGGLAAAIALRRIGFDAQVYEKRSSISGGEGTMIVLAPNGMRALSRICPGVEEKLVAAGCPSPEVVFLSRDGQQMGSTVLGQREDGQPKFEFPFVAIAWSTALRTLRGELPPLCLHPGHTFLGLEQTEGAITASFESLEGETVLVQADLLVGADGIHSACRRALFGLGPECVVDQGRTMWRAMGKWEDHPVPEPKPGAQYIIAGPRTFNVSDVSSGQIYIALAVLDSEWEGGHPRRSKNGAEALAALRELFADCPTVLRAIEALPTDDLLERRVLECPVLKQWAQGRAVLIGDAAHAVPPTIGQGANLAFEDAWDLSFLLQQGAAVSDALMKLQAHRAPRVRQIVNINRASATSSYKGKLEGQPYTWDFIYTYQGAEALS